MKSGRTLSELAAELERQHSTKKDFEADTRRLSLAATPGGAGESAGVIMNGINGGMKLRATAHGQLASSLGIPKPYYDRMLADQPDLLATNVNRWLTTQPAKKLVRTLDGEVRALLSNSYRPLDNLDLAMAVLPKLQQLQANPLSCEVTEDRMYIKAVTEKVQGVVAKIQPGLHVANAVNDIIQAGVVISNSETGQGSLRVEALTYRLVCLNGAIHEAAVRKAHLGRMARGQDAIEDAREYFRTETRQADDRAFFLKVQDATAAMFDQARFELRINSYRDAADRKIPVEADPVKVVEVTSRRFGFNEEERKNILNHLIRGSDMSAWGLANAVTRASQDVESYDRATQLESFGGDIVELPSSQWKELVAV